MKTKLPSLGRGLSALIPDAGDDNTRGEFRTIPVHRVEANPLQPRREFNDVALHELADSIKEQGVLQPILVEETAGGNYKLLAGERRWRAAQLAGLDEIPSRVLTGLDEARRGIITLMENLQREDLNAMEFAEGCKRILEETHWTHEDLAGRLGRARTTISNTIRLLGLPMVIQESIRRGEISEGHGRALLGLDATKIQQLWREIIAEDLNVRQVESRVQELNGKPIPVRSAQKRVAVVDSELQIKLEENLKCLVKVSGTGSRGKIVLEFRSAETRELILSKLLPS